MMMTMMMIIPYHYEDDDVDDGDDVDDDVHQKPCGSFLCKGSLCSYSGRGDCAVKWAAGIEKGSREHLFKQTNKQTQ